MLTSLEFSSVDLYPFSFVLVSNLDYIDLSFETLRVVLTMFFPSFVIHQGHSKQVLQMQPINKKKMIYILIIIRMT